MGKGSVRYQWSHERAEAFSANARASHRRASAPVAPASAAAPAPSRAGNPAVFPRERATPAPAKDQGWPVFEALLRAAKLPAPCYEVQFNPVRKWRFDIAWPQHRIAVEVDGGIWSTGGHSSGRGILRDMEKGNAAQVAGWKFLRYTHDNLARAIDDIRAIIEGEAMLE